LIEPTVAALVRQRVFGTALGYEDLDDHDEVRHDPVMAVVAGKLEARRADCAPVAGTTHQCDVSSSSPEQSTNPPVAVVAMLESQALNGVAQPGLLLAGCRSPPMPIIAGSADTGELAHGARFRSRLATGTPVIVWMTS
jgi:hypothetical protein